MLANIVAYQVVARTERLTAHTYGTTKGMLQLGNLVVDALMKLGDESKAEHLQVCLGGAFPSLGKAEDIRHAVLEYGLGDVEKQAESLRNCLKAKELQWSFLPDIAPVSCLLVGVCVYGVSYREGGLCILYTPLSL